MSDLLVALAERGLAKRQKSEAHEEKIAAGTALNPVINERLVVWGEWHLGQRHGEGGGSSMLAALIETQGEMIRCTANGVDMSDYVYDTDRAVNQLEPFDKALVYEQYLEVSSTPEQRAAAVGVSRRTFFRKLALVHSRVLFLLTRKPGIASPVRDVMLKKCQR